MNHQSGVPSDNTTLTAVLAEYEAAGYTGQFEVISDAAIACVTCGEESDPRRVRAGRAVPLEGHPILTTCCRSSPCRARAAAPGNAGARRWAERSADEAAVGKQLRDQRGDGGPPPPAPGE